MNKPTLCIHVQCQFMNTDDMEGLAITAARYPFVCPLPKKWEKDTALVNGYKVVIVDWQHPPSVIPLSKVVYGHSLLHARVAEFDTENGWQYDD